MRARKGWTQSRSLDHVSDAGLSDLVEALRRLLEATWPSKRIDQYARQNSNQNLLARPLKPQWKETMPNTLLGVSGA